MIFVHIDLADIEDGYCEKVTPGSCPKMNAADNERHSNQHTSDSISYDDLLKDFLAQLIEKSDILVYLVVTAITVLLFTLGHYFISNNRKENVLISKLNILEKKLMTSDKECLLLKNELLDTRNKLASIEDNSFGSNDMVIALKKELEINVAKNEELQQQVATLDKVSDHNYTTIDIKLGTIIDYDFLDKFAGVGGGNRSRLRVE